MHQANREAVFAWLDACNYDGTESLRLRYIKKGGFFYEYEF